MAWEARWRQRYYYRSKRVGNRIVKVYMGKGPEAESAAREDAAKRADRAVRRHAAEVDRMRDEPAKDMMAELDGQVRIMLETALVAAGYHQHDRGRWRKKRNGKESRTTK